MSISDSRALGLDALNKMLQQKRALVPIFKIFRRKTCGSVNISIIMKNNNILK